jgi:S-adenosylmethionine:tRNA ribosyltransferase-isomerase
MLKTLPPAPDTTPGTMSPALRLASGAVLDDLEFEVPPALEAGEPPEARGLARDEVRLMVSHLSDDRILHARFRDLVEFVAPGDVLVINTSGTLSAALDALRAAGTPLEATQGETLRLPGGATATLHAPYSPDRSVAPRAPVRLWIASLDLPRPVNEYLAQHGFPIRYSYVREPWPIAYYQTVYATEAGSAEMPSAGRAFTPEMITRLVARGVQIATLILHTGVASPEAHEPPYEEYYRVPAQTARAVNAAREAGQRVIAVGTTVVRALETVTDTEGVTHPGEGWTRLVITPERGLRAVHALLTGLHESRSSHLALLESLAGAEHLRLTYAEALRQGYLWHEFGDLHLILP